MSVHIEDNGFYLVHWDRDRNTRHFALIEPDGILQALRHRCEIGLGVTLAGLFEMVETYPPLKEFLGRYSSCPIEDIHAQVKGESLTDPYKAEFPFLEVYLDLPVRTNPYLRGEYLILGRRVGFRGASDRTRRDEHWPKPPGHEIKTRQVSFLPMSELAGLYVVANHTAKLSFPSVGGITKRMISMDADLTFLEVLDAIYSELSPVAEVEDNPDYNKAMQQRIDEADDAARRVLDGAPYPHRRRRRRPT